MAIVGFEFSTVMGMYELVSEPDGVFPVLVLGMEGWVDAGFAAAGAIGTLLSTLDTDLVADFNIDELLDLRSRRPMSRIVEGVNEELEWPSIELRAGRDARDRLFLVLTGPEPDLRWRAFADSVIELAEDFGVTRLVGLGAFPAPAAHTRPMRLAASATTTELANQDGFINATVEVPAGIHAALERAAADSGLEAIGLWARVPHYVSNMPYPLASVALLEALERIGGVDVPHDELAEAGTQTLDKLNELIANSDEHAALVSQLEQQADAEDARIAFASELPSGDELADELERFLREQGNPS